MSSSEGHHQRAAEAALGEAARNPVWSAEQWFLAAQIHALPTIEARLAQLVANRSDLVVVE